MPQTYLTEGNMDLQMDEKWLAMMNKDADTILNNNNNNDNPESEPGKANNQNNTSGGKDEDRELFRARVILLSAPVDAKLAHSVNAKLLALERFDDKSPISIFINSPGGEVHSGFAIFDMLRFISCPVITIVSGLAASMGSIIALAAPRERRFCFPNAKFLIHQPSVSGVAGTVSDIEIHAKDLLETKSQIIDLYARETGQPTDEIRKALDRDKWMTAEQAQAFGLISKIISRRGDLPKSF